MIVFLFDSCKYVSKLCLPVQEDLCIPVLRNDGVAQNLLLGGSILALLRERRLVLLLLEFATHIV